MARKDCPAGTSWSYMLVDCVKNERVTEQPVVAVDPPGASVASVRASSAVMLSPALWSCVALVTLGSILALGVWAFIYKRQRRRSSFPGASVPVQEPLPDPLDKQPPTETTNETPSHCPHLLTGAQAGFRWGDGGPTAGRGPAGGGGQDAGPPACTEGHRIPLPATELGGTALVTTKTV